MLTNSQIDFMNKGTAARLSGTFGHWAQIEIEYYWALVAKFNEEA